MVLGRSPVPAPRREWKACNEEKEVEEGRGQNNIKRRNKLWKMFNIRHEMEESKKIWGGNEGKTRKGSETDVRRKRGRKEVSH